MKTQPNPLADMIDKSMTTPGTAQCECCRRALTGKPYHLGGLAYDPDTGERCPSNHFGGFVCSEHCDVQVCLRMLGSMPGAGETRSLDSYCQSSVDANWSAK